MGYKPKEYHLNQYEIAVLFDPQLEVDLEKATDKVEKLFSTNKGKIVKKDNWGKKKLAYKIQKHDQAIYVFYIVDLPAESVKKLEATLNITDEVIRYLITRVDHKALAKAEAARAEKVAKAKARGEDLESTKSEDDDESVE